MKDLVTYSSLIPEELVQKYVTGLTKTYIGRMGSSARWNRTAFFADAAATYIPSMFEKFDDASGTAFVEAVRRSEILQRRIQTPTKLRRLRSLGIILIERVSETFSEKAILEALCDESREEEFLTSIKLKA